ncbi:MAG: phosphoribosylglycinamide formyltransferase [bacterium]
MNIGIFISGSGTNMEAVCKNFLKGDFPEVSQISFVLSDKKNAAGIEKAKSLGINTIILPKEKGESREQHETRVLSAIKPYNTKLIVLAGFMKILGSTFLSGYSGKVINIHPSLLPAFKGVDAQKQAFEYGVKVSGCSVHFVDETLDGGPVILQRPVFRENSDTLDSFKAKILSEEHKALSEAVAIVSAKKYSVSGRFVLL